MAVMDSVRDCTLCGATDVPVKWSWQLYSHRQGRPYGTSDRAPYSYVGSCRGESADSHFHRMLRNAALEVSAPGMRYVTDSEQAAKAAREKADNEGTLF